MPVAFLGHAGTGPLGLGLSKASLRGFELLLCYKPALLQLGQADVTHGNGGLELALLGRQVPAGPIDDAFGTLIAHQRRPIGLLGLAPAVRHVLHVGKDIGRGRARMLQPTDTRLGLCQLALETGQALASSRDTLRLLIALGDELVPPRGEAQHLIAPIGGEGGPRLQRLEPPTPLDNLLLGGDEGSHVALPLIVLRQHLQVGARVALALCFLQARLGLAQPHGEEEQLLVSLGGRRPLLLESGKARLELWQGTRLGAGRADILANDALQQLDGIGGGRLGGGGGRQARQRGGDAGGGQVARR